MIDLIMFFNMILLLLFSTFYITAINSFSIVAVTMMIPPSSFIIKKRQQHQLFYSTITSRHLHTKYWNIFRDDNNNNLYHQIIRRRIHHYAIINRKGSMSIHDADDDNNNNGDDNTHDDSYITQKDTSNKKQKIINSSPFNLLESSAMYDDKKPSRRNHIILESTESTKESTESPLVLWKNDVNPWNDWGIERQQQHQKASSSDTEKNQYNNDNNNYHYFPDTMDDVSNDIYNVCMAVLYQNYNNSNDDDNDNSNNDFLSPDPNIVRNSYVDNIYNKRPVRSYPKDSGRIGIEIDGASLLLLSKQQHNNNNNNNNNVYIDQRKMIIRSALYDDNQFNSIALIQLALRIGQKLSSSTSQQWMTTTPSNNNNNTTSSRKVLIYFNTIQHALLASKEYQRIKLEQQTQWYNDNNNNDITILSLDHDIPMEFINKNTKYHRNNNNNNKTEADSSSSNSRKRRRTGIELLPNVNPTESIILIVNPTDYNSADGIHKPPGPSYNILYYLQKIISNAGIYQLPVIMLSPRLFVNEQYQHNDVGQRQQQGNDYSNGYQQSSIYGGIEPPNHTPWILRDFTPPSYCWIGNAMRINHNIEQQKHQQKHQQNQGENNDNNRRSNDNKNNNKIDDDDNCGQGQYSHLVLVQSVLHPKHSWHLFASKVCYRPNDHSKYQRRHNMNSDTNRNSIKLSNDNDNDDDDNHQRFLYEYLCSTKAASGRPTRSIMKQVFQQYASYRWDD